MRGVDMLMAFPYILLALGHCGRAWPRFDERPDCRGRRQRPVLCTQHSRHHGRDLRAASSSTPLGWPGWGIRRIILTELLPNVLPVIVIAMSTTVGWMILETAGLSFLGLGSQPPQADLGSMLGEARSAMISHPHTSIVPGIMIFLIVMSINLLGDGVRDALDPRLRSGALSRPRATTLVERVGDTPAATDDLLAIQDLETQFHVGQRVYRAVGGVSLAVKPGECLGVIGESGSGKSVTALSVMGLVASPPGVITGGAVRFQGEDLIGAPYESLRRKRGDRVAYIFQDPLSTLHPLYRIGQQLAEAIKSHHKVSNAEARERAIQLLNDVRIPNAEARVDNYPHEMSGGMRQRIGIAMALANAPDVIIADEPTTALDVTVQAQILTLLDDLRRDRGLAIIFITHDFGVVAQLCDRVAVMYAGRIVEEGPTASRAWTRPRTPTPNALIACVPELGGGRRELLIGHSRPAAGRGRLASRLRICARAATRRRTPADMLAPSALAGTAGITCGALPLSRGGLSDARAQGRQ